jgi:CDP-glycerol glycerophosphotransferase
MKSKVRRLMHTSFDLYSRTFAITKVASELQKASIKIEKHQTVVFIDSNERYGNLRECAIAFHKAYPEVQMCFLAMNQKAIEWAEAHKLPVRLFDLRANKPENAKTWDLLLRANVCVLETHPWFRSKRLYILNSLLVGAKKVQLWHGSTGPIGKEIGTARLQHAPALWHFTSLAAASVGFDVLINEPNKDEQRRMDRVQAKTSVHDIEFRLVDEFGKKIEESFSRRILVAPTFPEGKTGDNELLEMIRAISQSSKQENISVDLSLHPLTKKSLRRKMNRISGVTTLHSKVSAIDLKKYSGIVTDYSSIAHDALLLGVPICMYLVNLESYAANRQILIDQTQMEIAYQIQDVSQAAKVLSEMVDRDPLRAARHSWLSDIASKLDSKPGLNTLNAIHSLAISSKKDMP